MLSRLFPLSSTRVIFHFIEITSLRSLGLRSFLTQRLLFYNHRIIYRFILFFVKRLILTQPSGTVSSFTHPASSRHIIIMTLSKNQDDPPEHHRKRFYSDTHAFIGYMTPKTPDSSPLEKNNIVMSPIHNLNSHQPQSPSERMSPVKQHPDNHHHHHDNRSRSKSESETTNHRSSYKKKGTNSPGGHYRRVNSPMSVASSPKYRSLGKMWIRPVPVKNQWNQVSGQHGPSDSHLPMPFLPDFGCQSSCSSTEDMMLYTTPNSSFDTFQRSSELNIHSSSKKTAFTFGESGKPLSPSLAKRHSPTSVI